MVTYLLFDERTCRFQVLNTISEDLSPLLQRKTLVDAGDPLKGGEGVGSAASDCLARMDNVLYYVTYFMFEHSHSLDLNFNLYSGTEDWAELLQYVPEGGHLLQVF